MTIQQLTVLSLGAGVQSSTLALMFKHKEINPVPDFAIFADTGAEPRAVYQWLDWLEPQLPFPVHRVMKDKGLTQHIKDSLRGERFAGAPFFTESKNGGGQLRRQCTREFKIEPIKQKIRELAGLRKGERAKGKVHVVQYLGISLDEVARMKHSQDAWIDIRYPLIDKRMTRHDCLLWLERGGYPEPPRSACVFCPYRSNNEWRDIRDTDQAGWDEAIAIDEQIRNGVRGTTEKLYLHRSLIPLKEVNLSTPEENGQLGLWDSECEGMCGV